MKQNGNFFVFFCCLRWVPSWRVKTEWKSPRVLHRGNTFKAIAHKTYIRIVASLVIPNAHAQDKIINNDPVLNRNLAEHFMDESIHSLAVAAGIGTVMSGDIVFDARKIVVTDRRISSLSHAA